MVIDIHCIITNTLIGFDEVIHTHAVRPVPTTNVSVSSATAALVPAGGFVLRRYSMADACHPFWCVRDVQTANITIE